MQLDCFFLTVFGCEEGFGFGESKEEEGRREADIGEDKGAWLMEGEWRREEEEGGGREEGGGGWREEEGGG